MRTDSSGPIVALVALAALTGCAATPPTTAKLTYESVPAGAQLFEGDKPLGMEPITRDYSSDGKPGTIRTPDVTAVWPSGAKTTFYTYLDLGADRVATLARPADAPGLQADLDNATKVSATRQRELERQKALQHSDIAQGSARCKEQQAQGNKGLTDDCM
ncbi:MAG: hypothetical protein KGL25_07780 [Gammaproteobacteria bacterium]|nr:hypothetical protein [Gammaproteobacteria bacterium]